MSKLEQRKRRARFETSAVVFSRGNRAVIVELLPDRMVLTLKGCRTPYALPYDKAYMYALQKALLASRVARMQARKAKRQGGAS